jgi:hypothetical protein
MSFPDAKQAIENGFVGIETAERFRQSAGVGEFKAKQYDAEAKTWAAMTQHMYVIADALAEGIAKQFPDKFR